MRFTKVQVALYLQDIPFVHMAPDYERRDEAEIDFQNAIINKLGDPVDLFSERDKVKFMISKIMGESTSHVPVLFLKDSFDMEPVPLSHARYIASPINGVGPIIIDS